MVDVGCGIGGSSRHIARRLGCTARGITLSPVQVPSPMRTYARTLRISPKQPIRCSICSLHNAQSLLRFARRALSIVRPEEMPGVSTEVQWCPSCRSKQQACFSGFPADHPDCSFAWLFAGCQGQRSGTGAGLGRQGELPGGRCAAAALRGRLI